MKTKNGSSSEVGLHDLLVLKLKALYDIETQLVKALPKMAKKSDDADLAQGFNDHLEETKNQVQRLEEALQILGEPVKKLKVDAIRGLTKDADWVMKSIKDKAARDAGLIGAAEYVEYYEIAGYKTAIEWAKLMGHNAVAELLTTTLNEEITASQKLADLANAKINNRANDMVAMEA